MVWFKVGATSWPLSSFSHDFKKGFPQWTEVEDINPKVFSYFQVSFTSEEKLKTNISSSKLLSHSQFKGKICTKRKGRNKLFQKELCLTHTCHESSSSRNLGLFHDQFFFQLIVVGCWLVGFIFLMYNPYSNLLYFALSPEFLRLSLWFS